MCLGLMRRVLALGRRVVTRSACVILVGVSACGGNASAPVRDLPGALVFSGADEQWTGGAAEYSPSLQAEMDVVLERRAAPGTASSGPNAFYTAGANFSDDLFLFIKRPIAGLRPLGYYRARFCVTAVVSGAGQYLIAKAGVTQGEPAVTVGLDGAGQPYYVLNIDKGVALEGGRDAVVLGRLGEFGGVGGGYMPRTLCSSVEMTVQADNAGTVWMIVGADSDFEVYSEIYWMRTEVLLENL